MTEFDRYSKAEENNMAYLFQQNDVEDFCFTQTSSQYDGQFTTKSGREAIFEVKNRAVSHNTYNTTIIEKSKFDYMRKAAKEMKVQPLLFVFFKDNKYLTIDLNTANPRFNSIYAPATTAVSSNKILKEMAHFNIQDYTIREYDKNHNINYDYPRC